MQRRREPGESVGFRNHPEPPLLLGIAECEGCGAVSQCSHLEPRLPLAVGELEPGSSVGSRDRRDPYLPVHIRYKKAPDPELLHTGAFRELGSG